MHVFEGGSCVLGALGRSWPDFLEVRAHLGALLSQTGACLALEWWWGAALSAPPPRDLEDGLIQGTWDEGQDPGWGNEVETQRPLCIRCQMHFCQMDQSSL